MCSGRKGINQGHVQDMCSYTLEEDLLKSLLSLIIHPGDDGKRILQAL